jgi:hypothetical protein
MSKWRTINYRWQITKHGKTFFLWDKSKMEETAALAYITKISFISSHYHRLITKVMAFLSYDFWSLTFLSTIQSYCSPRKKHKTKIICTWSQQHNCNRYVITHQKNDNIFNNVYVYFSYISPDFYIIHQILDQLCHFSNCNVAA